jgi:hypothetical protein
MDPHTISARKIADALTTIHREYSTLLPIDRVFVAGVFSLNEASFDARIDYMATVLEKLHPVEPVSGPELQELCDAVVDELNDKSTHEHLEDWLDQPEWMLRAEIDDRRTYMAEEEAE